MRKYLIGLFLLGSLLSAAEVPEAVYVTPAASFSWEAPQWSDASPPSPVISKYVLGFFPVLAGVPSSMELDVGTANVSVTVEARYWAGLLPETLYEVKVRAIEAGGATSGWSEPLYILLRSPRSLGAPTLFKLTQ